MAGEKLSKPERQQLVRDLVLAGVDDALIIDQFRTGWIIAEENSPLNGLRAKAHPETIKRDLKAISRGYRARTRDVEADQRVTGAALERLARTAAAAESAGRYSAAIRADVQLLTRLTNVDRHATVREDLDARIDRALGRQPQKRRGRGQPTKLTKAVIQAICDGIRLGLSQREAALHAGISEASFYVYVRQGEDDRVDGKTSIYTQYLEALERAQLHVKTACLATIHGAIRDGSWRAAFRLLESRHPEEFARRSPVAVNTQVNVQAQGPAVVQFNLQELSDFTPEQLRAVAYEPARGIEEVPDDEPAPPETSP
jgi:hypothetical protein